MSKTESSEAAQKANFSKIRYAQCWEDADVLLEGLDIQPGDRCLSIASAGDNAIAMLTCSPEKVVAVDLSPSQLHCLELRVAAYQKLEHVELLELIGSRESERRPQLYEKCKPMLCDDAARFWDAHGELIKAGIGGVGKFENYFRLFREKALALVHSKRRVDALLEPRTPDERRAFYDSTWNSWRWRMLFRFFFSRFVMGRLGRDPSFFDYVEGSVADRILSRTKHALSELDPSQNPYLQWILLGTHGRALPFALREENFDTIRENIDRLEWRLCSVEDYCESEPKGSVSRFNLSDIFEYMSQENFELLMRRLLDVAKPGGRFVYWNMLAPRSRPESMGSRIRPLETLSGKLHLEDKAFFYSRFIVEEVLE